MKKAIILILLILTACSEALNDNRNQEVPTKQNCQIISPFTTEEVIGLKKLLTNIWDYQNETIIIGPLKVDYQSQLGVSFKTYLVNMEKTKKNDGCGLFSDTDAGIEINYFSVDDRDKWTEFEDQDYSPIYVKGKLIINFEGKAHINATEIKIAKVIK